MENQEYDLPEVMASIMLSIHAEPVLNAKETQVTIDDFYDVMNIPYSMRTDFGTAAILRQATELIDGIKK